MSRLGYKTKRRFSPEELTCHECYGRLKHPAEYHPFLYCELVKLGHHDPAAYLASYGLHRDSQEERT